MLLVWTFTSTCLLLASTVATLFTMLHLRCRWDVTASSVRWLFWFFFLWVFVWCSMRAIFYMHMLTLPVVRVVHDNEGKVFSYSQLDRLGLHGLIITEGSKQHWVSVVLCTGDLALCGIALTLFPLTYELWRLARKWMDRGVKREREMIGRYFVAIVFGLVLYATAQLALVATYGTYEIHTQRCVLAVYMIQFLGMAFMAGLLYILKINGRKYETIHGTFVESPLYLRLKNIMLVYATFSFVFQLATLVINVYYKLPEGTMLDAVAFSLLSYNASGLALSITTSCSQACVFSTCRHCFPEDFEAEFMYHRFEAPKEVDFKAPEVNPVFVFTDIESSTALWNANSETMAAATEIHDNILRKTLLKHRGYEITTVGDAFQMAFHSIQDAIEYCMDVQLQLLVAKWPKGIDGAVPATKKERVKGRVVFNGLRVRMGIHDASDQDGGVLLRNVHVVTGKMVYSGVSEIIAEYVGDLGSGGQILITDRVAAWLRHHRADVSVDVFMDHVGQYTVPQVNSSVEIYQLQPLMLASRAQSFSPPPVTMPTLHPERTFGRFQLAKTASFYATRSSSGQDSGPETRNKLTLAGARYVDEQAEHYIQVASPRSSASNTAEM